MATGSIKRPAAPVLLENVRANNASIAAGSRMGFAVDTPTIPGYEALGLIGMAATGTATISSAYVDGSTKKCTASLYNTTNAAITVSPIFVVLYRRV